MSISHYICTNQEVLDNKELRIPRLGIHETMNPMLINRSAGNLHYLVMIFHTAVSVLVKNEMIHCMPETVIVWEPNRQHLYGNENLPWEHSWIHVGGTLIPGLLKEAVIPVNRPVPLSGSHRILNCMQALYEELSSFTTPDEKILHSLVAVMFRELHRAVTIAPEDKVPAVLREIKQTLERDFRKPMKLEHLAKQACLSIPHFCAQFKKHFGISCIDYVIYLRMNSASFMLRDVNMSIKQIAAATGYEDFYYFSKLFKKRFGCSPRDYRKSILSPRT